jgi:hypothetical protein
LLKTIINTKLTAILVDKTQINSVTGKPLQNSESSINFSATTKSLEGISNFFSGAASFNLGNITVVAGLVGAIWSGFLGNIFSFSSKFLLILSFLSLTQLFNVNYDYILEKVLDFFGSLTKVTFMTIQTETELGA